MLQFFAKVHFWGTIVRLWGGVAEIRNGSTAPSVFWGIEPPLTGWSSSSYSRDSAILAPVKKAVILSLSVDSSLSSSVSPSYFHSGLLSHHLFPSPLTTLDFKIYEKDVQILGSPVSACLVLFHCLYCKGGGAGGLG